MTNPEQMLELAQICYPNKHWKIIRDRVWECFDDGEVSVDAEIFEPRSRSILGQAQLMQVVFSTAKALRDQDIEINEIGDVTGAFYDALANKDKETLIIIAIDVLC